MSKLIPDVSHWVYVKDWDKLNVEFMIAKATQGTSCTDPKVSEFIAGCEKHGIPYWLYCYLNKGNELEQTKYMVSVCKGKIGEHFVGYALDFEKDNKEADIIECINYIKSIKEKCLVYGKCALSAIKKTYGENVGYWYARYGLNTGSYDPAYPVKTQYEQYVDLHQYTSVGTCAGLSCKGDLNRLTGKRSVEWFKTRYGASESVSEGNTESTADKTESWKGNEKYYLENSMVGEWQTAMNKGFDTTELIVDNKFGINSQTFAQKHILWSGQTHNCISAIRWLRKTLRDVYKFTKLPYDGYWDSYLDTCVETFQKNRNITPDKKVGLVTTYWLLSGIVK